MGERENGRKGERENGRTGERENGRKGEEGEVANVSLPLSPFRDALPLDSLERPTSKPRQKR